MTKVAVHRDMWVPVGRDYAKVPKACQRCGRRGTLQFKTFSFGGPWLVLFWRCTNEAACERRLKMKESKDD